MTCNRSDFEVTRKFWGTTREVELYLSDGDIRRIDGLLQMGAGASSVYAILVKRGVIAAGALSGPFTAMLGSVVVFYMGWIKRSNNGCGVELSTTLTPYGSRPATVTAQTRDDPWWKVW